MLPVHIGRQGKTESAFEKVFWGKSLEQGKALLAAALDSEMILISGGD